MAANTFGRLYRLTSFGESHGKAIGGVLDGIPSGWQLNLNDIQTQLNRRRPGQSNLTTSRQEQDQFEILSGLMDDRVTGTPLAFVVWNHDQRPKDYGNLENIYRPSHADFTYSKKYGIRDFRGGGRSSARETIARVVAGSVARQFLQQHGIHFTAYVSRIGTIGIEQWPEKKPDIQDVEASPVRCPFPDLSARMVQLIEETKAEGDTLGGSINCHINGLPAGLGEPVFDKLHADLAKAMMSINAVKGFEYGSGFAGTSRKGSEENDVFGVKDGNIRPLTNRSGGIQGGISNGEEVVFRLGFKPVATIMKTQQTVDVDGKTIDLKINGRHDVCVVPRAVVIVESMAAMVVMDHFLRWRALRF